jgi:hypothetical protein
MKQVTTYVGIDAHKKDLFIAMLMGNEKTPVTWPLVNEPNAVRRLVRKLEREAPGPVRVCVLRSRAVRVCAAASDDDDACGVSSHRAGADPSETG